MNFWEKLNIGLLLLILASLSGCVNYFGIHSNKKIASPAQFQTAKSLPQQKGKWPTTAWAKQFGDPQLVALIKEALACNPSLEAALARINQARALAQQKRAALFPAANAKGYLGRSKLSSHNLLIGPIGNSVFNYGIFLANLSYTLDIWGKNLASLRQAISEARAAEAADQEARLAIATSVASTYNQLAYYYELADVLQRTVKQREDLEKLTAVRLSTGLDSKVQSYQARNTSATARTQLVSTKGQILLIRQQLGTLLGKGPDRGLTIKRPRLSQLSTTVLPVNLPLNLLGRRPDIVSARWQVEASCQGIKHTKALFYPNVDLLAGVADLAVRFSHISIKADTEFLGPAISLPIFDGGYLRAQLRNQYAVYEEAVANYNETLNQALADVATQITNIKSLDEQLWVQREALVSAKKAYSLAKYQYGFGLASQLTVLNAETSYLTEQQRRLDLRFNQRNHQIALIKALGGGFNVCCRPNQVSTRIVNG